MYCKTVGAQPTGVGVVIVQRLLDKLLPVDVVCVEEVFSGQFEAVSCRLHLKHTLGDYDRQCDNSNQRVRSHLDILPFQLPRGKVSEFLYELVKFC